MGLLENILAWSKGHPTILLLISKFGIIFLINRRILRPSTSNLWPNEANVLTDRTVICEMGVFVMHLKILILPVWHQNVF